jgi:hypothetical protein
MSGEHTVTKTFGNVAGLTGHVGNVAFARELCAELDVR